MFPTERFRGKTILVGITGGIAAYKTIELIRYLVTQEAEVHVVMTSAAEKFVTRLTLETLSRNPVGVEMFPEQQFTGTHHIHLADRVDAAIIAPVSYNFIGKIASGIADDLLTTVVAALKAPVVIAPAMNVHMWENPILQENVTKLKKLGYLICPPEEGFLAEGYTGMGRLASLPHLVQYLYRAIHPQRASLTGQQVLITAGRTEEPIDPVRILTNRATGKMGFALAWEAFARGARVILINGNSDLPLPAEVTTVPVQTASEMWKAVEKYFPGTDVYISSAAIADYTPESPTSSKLKKQTGDFILKLKRTTDILGEIAQRRHPQQVIVGFAVETNDAEKNALEKLHRKNLDMIVLNNPREKGAGFATDTNRVTIFRRDGSTRELPILPKLDVAFHIFEEIVQFFKK